MRAAIPVETAKTGLYRLVREAETGKSTPIRRRHGDAVAYLVPASIVDALRGHIWHSLDVENLAADLKALEASLVEG